MDMPTNLAIDDDLLNLALEIGGLPSKKETVNEALREFIAVRKRYGMIEAFGTYDFSPDFERLNKEARKDKKR